MVLLVRLLSVCLQKTFCLCSYKSWSPSLSYNSNACHAL